MDDLFGRGQVGRPDWPQTRSSSDTRANNASIGERRARIDHIFNQDGGLIPRVVRVRSNQVGSGVFFKEYFFQAVEGKSQQPQRRPPNPQSSRQCSRVLSWAMNL